MGSSIPKNHPQDKIDLHVAKRYSIGKRIGRGCYGLVYAASRTTFEKEGTFINYYAIKKILSAFHNGDEAQRVYREVMYLKEFGEHDNILRLHDVMCSSDDRHLYVITDLCESDLSKALRVKALTASMHRVYVTYQILRALIYIHSASVMHRDVKPANILIMKSCTVQLADFGWARESPSDGNEEVLTDYAGSRWYRSPEMLFGSTRYTTSIDMWSLGCVVGEMHGDGQPLIGGTSTIDMVEKAIELLGKPNQADIASMNSKHAQQSMEPVNPGPPHRSVQKRYPEEKPQFHDFVMLLVQWNPAKRLSASEAMSHPFLNSFSNPDDEPTFGRRLLLEIPDSRKMPANRYRDQVEADLMNVEKAKEKVFWAKKKEEEQEYEQLMNFETA